MSEVEEIKDRLSVVDLVGEYIRVTKAGSSWKALCPFHNEKTPSFMLSEERRSWHCFGCGKGGDIFSFVMEMEGIGFREALEMLSQKAGVELKRTRIDEQGSMNKESRDALYKIMELSTKWYEKNLWEGKGKEKILKYLRERGLDNASIKKFRLGYAPDGWRNMLEFLTKRGYMVEDINKTGLLVEKSKNNDQRTMIRGDKNNTSHWSLVADHCYDRFRDRVMFPIQDIMGRVIGFSARVAPGGDEKTAKYINTPQTELYDKSRILYGLNFAKVEIKKRDETILVEGNMDVIASHQAGFPNTVAVSGTALTEAQIKAIKNYTSNLKMAFDMDAAGQAAAKKSARICLENDLDVRIVLLPGSKDAAEVIKGNKKNWEKAVGGARGVVEYFFEDAFSRLDPQNPTEKKKIARELLIVIKDIADPVEKSHWLKQLAEKLDVAEKVLVDVISRIKEQKPREEKSQTDVPRETEKGHILEKRILGLILAFPRETERKAQALKKEYFSGKIEKEIFEAYRGTDKKENPAGIKKKIFGYEAQKYLDEAIFEVEVEVEERGAFDPVQEFENAFSALRRRKFRERALEITHDIRQAEAEGKKVELAELMEEFQKIAEALKE